VTSSPPAELSLRYPERVTLANADLPVRKRNAERLLIKVLCSRQIVKDAHESRLAERWGVATGPYTGSLLVVHRNALVLVTRRIGPAQGDCACLAVIRHYNATADGQLPAFRAV